MDKLTVALREDRIVVLLSDEEIADLSDLRARASDAPASDLAVAVALLGPDGYEAILDPVSFRETYLARLATEDPDQPWREGVIRLRDFGVPDLDEITSPVREGDHLVFFARDTFSGLPYRADLALGDGSDLVYRPLGLQPVPDSPPPATPPAPAAPVIGPQPAPDDLAPPDPAELEDDDDDDDDGGV